MSVAEAIVARGSGVRSRRSDRRGTELNCRELSVSKNDQWLHTVASVR
jgi:hypothetical protein